MSEYFKKTNSLGGNVKVELDLSNYTIKQISKMQQVLKIYTSKFAKKADLASLIFNVDKLKNRPSGLSSLKSKVDKLVPASVDLSKLSDVEQNDVVKKNIEDEIPNITNLVTNINAKMLKQMRLKAKYLVLLN